MRGYRSPFSIIRAGCYRPINRQAAQGRGSARKRKAQRKKPRCEVRPYTPSRAERVAAVDRVRRSNHLATAIGRDKEIERRLTLIGYYRDKSARSARAEDTREQPDRPPLAQVDRRAIDGELAR